MRVPGRRVVGTVSALTLLCSGVAVTAAPSGFAAAGKGTPCVFAQGQECARVDAAAYGFDNFALQDALVYAAMQGANTIKVFPSRLPGGARVARRGDRTDPDP